jgi:NTE family protein
MRGLVLEGGGARGSYQVGALKAFKKRKIKFDGVVGTSIGSINGVFVVTGDYKKLENVWKSVSLKSLFEIDEDIILSIKSGKYSKDLIKSGVTFLLKIFKDKGMDTTNLKNLLNENINEEKFRKSAIDYGLATYNLTDRKPIKIYKNNIKEGKLAEYVLASAYYPSFKFEKIIDDKFYIDGGLFDRCPIDMLIDKGYDDIYIVRAHHNKLLIPKKENLSIKIIASKKSLGSIILFNRDTIQKNIKLGYYDTLRAIDKLDGNDYYFKHKSNEYYNGLFDEKIKNKILNKYNLSLLKRDCEVIIINIIEEIAKSLKLKVYKIYSIPLLLIKFKIKYRNMKKNKYYDFIKNIKIKLV